MSYLNILKKLFMINKETIYKIPVDPQNNVLIISPHPDDETLGCGGTILKMISMGVNITVVLLSDGAAGGKASDIKQIRRNEFLKSKEILGYTSSIHLNFPDSKLQLHKKEIEKQLYNIISHSNPALIFIPYFLDANLDHIIANMVLAKVLNKINSVSLKIAQYEIWTPITYPNCYINITNEYEKKILAMKCYASQEAYFKIIDKMTALNSLRAGLSMCKKFRYMESYKILSTKDYQQTIKLLGRLLDSR